DQDGEPTTAVVLDWNAATAPPPDQRWTKSLRLLRRILITALADHGKDMQPFLDAPTVRACDLETVRAEFVRQYVAEGSTEQKADTCSKAFRRTIRAAQEQGLVGVREIAEKTFVWLARPEHVA